MKIGVKLEGVTEEAAATVLSVSWWSFRQSSLRVSRQLSWMRMAASDGVASPFKLCDEGQRLREPAVGPKRKQPRRLGSSCMNRSQNFLWHLQSISLVTMKHLAYSKQMTYGYLVKTKGTWPFILIYLSPKDQNEQSFLSLQLFDAWKFIRVQTFLRKVLNKWGLFMISDDNAFWNTMLGVYSFFEILTMLMNC